MEGNQYALLEGGPEPTGGRTQVNREPVEQMTIRAEGTTEDHVWANTHRRHTLNGTDFEIFEYKAAAGTRSYPTAWTIRYTGGPVLAGAVASIFEEQGVRLRWDRPMEERGAASDIHEVVVLMAAQGGYDAMKAAYRAARKVRGRVEVEPSLDDEDDDGGPGSEQSAPQPHSD